MTSLGCPKNTIDTGTLLSKCADTFEKMELVSEPDQADILIVNTCSFIKSAVQESIDVILGLAQGKNTHQKLLVFGCLTGRYGEETLRSELPEVDIFAGPEEFDKAMAGISALHKATSTCPIIQTAQYSITPHWRSYVKISEGCSNHCTYCIIPKIRGQQRCRAPKAINAEIKGLIANGVCEITLVAQDLTAYEWNGLGLEGLLALISEELSKARRKIWLRLLYLNIGRITESLLNVIANEPNICPYLDIPVQHASDQILKKMGRGYDNKKLEETLAMIKKILPEFTLRTTVMLGFPGETAEDMEALCAFVEKWQFDHLGAFAYSDEDECAAHNFDEKINSKTAGSRLKKIMKIQERISKKKNKMLIGKTLDVLVEGASDETPHLLIGRAAFQAPEIDGVVYINDGAPKTGAFNRVRITDSHIYDLVGEAL